jgi:hypothetical protein
MWYVPNMVRLCRPSLPDIDGYIRPRIAFSIMIVAVALWAIGEVVLRLIRVSSIYLPRLRTARRLIILILCLALGVLTFRLGGIAWHWMKG